MSELADAREEGLVATVEFDAARLRALRHDDPLFNSEMLRLGMVVWAAFNTPNRTEVQFVIKDVEELEREDPSYLHADGGVICGACGREYRRHPVCEAPYQWLNRLCDGMLVKL